MDKIVLFLLLLFCIQINAYEIEVSRNVNEESYRFFIDSHSNFLQLKYIQHGNTSYYNESNSLFWGVLNTIQKTKNSDNFNNGSGYVSRNTFNILLKENKELLNDFYIEATQQILNYYYNNINFTNAGHIIYNNYQILYDENGLAVESIVNGDWAGLYDESELNKSGYLYNKNGELVYKNGLPANWMEKLFDKFKFNKIINDSLSLYGSVCLVVVIVCGIVVCIERFTDFSLIALIGRLGK